MIYPKSNRGKMLDSNKESEDSFDESDNVVGNGKKQDAYRS